MSVDELLHQMKRNVLSDTEAHDMVCLVAALMAEREAWHRADGDADLVGDLRGDYGEDEWTKLHGLATSIRIREAAARVDEIIGRIGK